MTKNKLQTVSNQPGVFLAYCPGCEIHHAIHTTVPNGQGAKWTFSGDLENPTFSPSLNVTYKWADEEYKDTCHSFIRNGEWQYLSDCTHHLAGKSVPMQAVE